MNSGGYEVQIQEMRRLMRSTSDAQKMESMKLAIAQLTQKQQKYMQNLADGTDEIELDPFQDFTQSPSVTSGNTRPMSSRPMSARRRSVPNLNAVPENKNMKMTVKNPINTPSAINSIMMMSSVSQMTSPPSGNVSRQNRRGSIPNAVSITEDIFSPQLLSGTAEKMEMIGSGPSAVVASSKIKSERRDREDSGEMNMSLGMSSNSFHNTSHHHLETRGSMKDSPLGASRSLQSLHNNTPLEPLDKYDGYSSSESISSTTSDRTPITRKRRVKQGKGKQGILGSLDDVIEELPIFNLASDLSLMGNFKEIAPDVVGPQYCTSGYIDCFGEPLVQNSAHSGRNRSNGSNSKSNNSMNNNINNNINNSNNNKSEKKETLGANNQQQKVLRQPIAVNFTPWITTGLFPQFYNVTMKKKLRLKKIVVVASGVRRMHLEIFQESSPGSRKMKIYSNTAGENGVNDESSIGLTVHSFDLSDGGGGGEKTNEEGKNDAEYEKTETKDNDSSGSILACEIKLVIEATFTNCHFVCVQALKIMV